MQGGHMGGHDASPGGMAMPLGMPPHMAAAAAAHPVSALSGYHANLMATGASSGGGSGMHAMTLPNTMGVPPTAGPMHAQPLPPLAPKGGPSHRRALTPDQLQLQRQGSADSINGAGKGQGSALMPPPPPPPPPLPRGVAQAPQEAGNYVPGPAGAGGGGLLHQRGSSSNLPPDAAFSHQPPHLHPAHHHPHPHGQSPLASPEAGGGRDRAGGAFAAAAGPRSAGAVHSGWPSEHHGSGTAAGGKAGSAGQLGLTREGSGGLGFAQTQPLRMPAPAGPKVS